MKGFNDKLASLYIDPLITETVKTFKQELLGFNLNL